MQSFGLQYARILFSIQHITVQYSTVLYCTVLVCTLDQNVVVQHVFFSILYSALQYCSVVYCTVLYCTVLYCRPKRREITCFSHTVQNITIIQGSHYFILAHFRSYCILYVYPYINSFRRNIGFLMNISYVLINSNFTCLSHFEKKPSLTILCHNMDLSFVIELCVCPLFCCFVNWNLFQCFFFMCIVNV